MSVSSPQVLPRVTHLIQEGIDRRLHHGMQVYVSLQGKTVADFAVGENAPGQPLARTTLMLWMSSGKPLTATAVLRLVEAGELELDRPVADIIPEFAQAGKEGITLQHLLTHTAGLKPIVSGWPHASWDEIVRRISAAELQEDWRPGARAGYDPSRSWFILGELVQRIDGRPFSRLIREDILEPLGMMDSWLAIPGHIYRAYEDRIGVTYSLKDGALTPTHSHERDVCEQASPGGSMRGPARELGAFYEMLLRRGSSRRGHQILREETVEQMLRRQREGMFDETFHHQIDFGLGLIINSNRYGAHTVPYGFGRYASDEAFGHGGAQSSVGFVDPRHDLVVVLVANGCPGEVQHNQRFRGLTATLYEELELAEPTPS